MKDLQFRYYDKYTGYTYPILQIDWTMLRVQIAENRWINLQNKGDGTLCLNNDDYAIDQYVGFSDPQGNKIYTGDIVFKKGYGKKGVIRRCDDWLRFEVFFGVGTGGGDITTALGNWNQKICHLCNDIRSESIHPSTIEVVGCIWDQEVTK